MHDKRGDAQNIQFLEIPADELRANANDFDVFLREQYRGLVHFLRRRTATEQDAEDATQESMLRLTRYQQTEPAEAWSPLLYTIAINVVRDQVRRRNARHGEAHQPLDEAARELVADEATHAQRVSDQQALTVIRELILLLPPRCRQIYLLNRVDGMTYTEIARHCGISAKAVEKQMTKALKALRQRLGERGLDTYQEV